MNKQKLANIFLFVIVIALATGFTTSYFKRTKVAYVQIAEVYNNFTMQKQMQQQLDKVQQARKLMIDSMGIKLNMMSQQLGERAKTDTAFGIRRNEYVMQERQFEQDNAATAQRYQEQIWKQLNQYINDYGKENGYSYILGAEGSGAVMYADQTNNITEAIKTYVNKRYSGVK